MNPEKKEDREAVVLDTNNIPASILKQGSHTRQAIIYLTDILGVETLIPEKALQEIEEHLEEPSKRKKNTNRRATNRDQDPTVKREDSLRKRV